MSAKMQAKLLRVLESKTVRPVGGSSERRVNVRILAATHASLEAQVNREAFRQDLYFRMCPVTVELPRCVSGSRICRFSFARFSPTWAVRS